ncbi:MAG: ABC transporter permease [Sulfurimonas sp.]|nr:MAG: ABC transporter permease [Sulfurimonas sp.]
MVKHILNIYRLVVKEIQTLLKDKVMLFLIFYSFSFAIYISAKATSTELVNAPITFVDEDRSMFSQRVIDSFYKPMFNTPELISYDEMDRGMDRGLYTFVVVIPSGFERDLIEGRKTELQLNIDATRMSQAGIGAGYISQIISQEVASFLKLPSTTPKIGIVPTYKYNPNLTGTWFGSINEVIDNIMTFSILLAAAALMREREHGTIEHLLVMPINTAEIILSKIFATMVVILVSVIFSLYVIVDMLLQVPLAGSMTLFLFSSLLVLFSTTSIGIFIGTITKSMPQLGMMFMLVVLPLMMLSGGITPYESMPEILQYIMRLSPTSHFIDVAQAILFRGAGFEVVWKHLLAIFAIGVFFFTFALLTFKKSIES